MEWISVKERLPEPNERILAYCPNMTEADIGPVSVQWGWTCKRKRSDISHWMPLPESPNEFTDCQADVEEYEEMTIEEAIKHCEEVSRRSPCTPCEREHMRLAAWLTELVFLRAQQEPNEPLEIIFGRGEIAVDTVTENDSAPQREIMLRKLESPVLPIGSPTGAKGKFVNELKNIIVRMYFENSESVKVLIRAANIVLEGFGEQPNEPLTLEELRQMDGEKIYIRYIGHCKDLYEDETAPYYGKNEQYIQHYNGMLQACDLPLQYYGEEWIAYRRKPEQEEKEQIHDSD